MAALSDAPTPLAAVPDAEEGAAPTSVDVGPPSALLHPHRVARESLQLGKELAAVLRGTDEIDPAGDKRFADPAWTTSPAYRRLGQSYLAVTGALTRLVDDYEKDGADWRAVERARFAVNAVNSTLAPTNTFLGNPAAVKRAVETGGKSVVRGVRNLAGDVLHNGGMPMQTDRSAYQVGRDLGLTKGSVVYRDEVVELLQYAPTTPQVHARPLVIVPPPIGRYYFLDLRPGRSFVEHAVASGLQVFLLSWRNPTRSHAHWNLDTYAERVRRAVAVAKEITGSPDVNTLGFCAGGIVQTALLNHLAALGDSSVHSAAYAVTLLDFDQRAPIGAFSGKGVVGLARRLSRTRGVITARGMGSAFTWMRPEDLVFNYLRNQWLMGEAPPAFDVLAWNADGTNLPAALHDQFLEAFRDNALVVPGKLTALGTPLDLASITVPTFVTGALTDHLTPWTGTYRTTQLLSGPSTYVLSSSGHIQSLVNPPGNPRSSYWTGGTAGPDPEEWRAGATKHTGSWWEYWAGWTAERSGDLVDAPTALGSSSNPAKEPAPGLYVQDRLPA